MNTFQLYHFFLLRQDGILSLLRGARTTPEDHKRYVIAHTAHIYMEVFDHEEQQQSEEREEGRTDL